MLKNRQKLLFYFFLIILVLARIAKIINYKELIRFDETQNLFISSTMADGITFNPLYFLDYVSWGGIGHFIYSLVAVPFLLAFGKSYFSLRLASLIFIVLTCALTYKFCNKYFGLRTAVISSLLFLLSPDSITVSSIDGTFRHFHINLFFILSLYFFSRIIETKKTSNFILFSLVSGLGVLFYPGFLAFLPAYGLFLLFDLDIRKPSSIYKYIITGVGVIVIANLLTFLNVPGYNRIFMPGDSPKAMYLSGNILSLVKRFMVYFFWTMPNETFVGVPTHIALSFHQGLKSVLDNLTTLSKAILEIKRLIFITSFISLCWFYKSYLKKFFVNALTPFLRKSYHITTSDYITGFLLTNIIIYITLFSFNQLGSSYYLLPLLLNVVLIIAIFLDRLWQKSKYLSLSLLLLILSPCAVSQLKELKVVSLRGFYKHYLCFYSPAEMTHRLYIRPDFVYKFLCDNCNINMCYLIGCTRLNNPSDDMNLLQKHFEYLSGGNSDKLRYLYEGYITEYMRTSDFKVAISIIERINEKYRNFCYIGAGNSLFSYYEVAQDLINWEIILNKLKETSYFIGEEYKKYFFWGAGEGLARAFAVPYTNFADNNSRSSKILCSYLKSIKDKENRDAFLNGFFNRDAWARF
jgi:hypothetical protein